jgi:hypothetical protein
VIAEEHRLELDHRVLQLEVALELRDEPAAADVADVDVDALLLLADRVGEPAPPPRLDLDELPLLAVDDLTHARLHALGAVRVDIRPQDVNGLVLFVTQRLRCGNDVHECLLA